jgi:hypothetical protein
MQEKLRVKSLVDIRLENNTNGLSDKSLFSKKIVIHVIQTNVESYNHKARWRSRHLMNSGKINDEKKVLRPSRMVN